MIHLQITPDIQALIYKVGDFIRSEGLTFDPSAVETKGINDLVSYVDKTAEVRLIEGLKAILPGSGFITEESGNHNEESEFRWIIDPLDGTTNFIHGIPAYCIIVALQFQQTTVLGFVYEINRDRFFEFGLSPWDVAAGAFLVQQAGGLVTDFSNQPGFLFGQEIVAATPAIHKSMLAIINTQLSK